MPAHAGLEEILAYIIDLHLHPVHRGIGAGVAKVDDHVAIAIAQLALVGCGDVVPGHQLVVVEHEDLLVVALHGPDVKRVAGPAHRVVLHVLRMPVHHALPMDVVGRGVAKLIGRAPAPVFEHVELAAARPVAGRAAHPKRRPHAGLVGDLGAKLDAAVARERRLRAPGIRARCHDRRRVQVVDVAVAVRPTHALRLVGAQFEHHHPVLHPEIFRAPHEHLALVIVAVAIGGVDLPLVPGRDADCVLVPHGGIGRVILGIAGVGVALVELIGPVELKVRDVFAGAECARGDGLGRHAEQADGGRRHGKGVKQFHGGDESIAPRCASPAGRSSGDPATGRNPESSNTPHARLFHN